MREGFVNINDSIEMMKRAKLHSKKGDLDFEGADIVLGEECEV